MGDYKFNFLRMVGYNYGYPMMGYGVNGWMGGFFSIIWIIILVMIIIAAIRFLRNGGRMHGGMMHGGCRHCLSGSSSAMDILSERYAKGEIDKQDFESKKKDLMS